MNVPNFFYFLTIWFVIILALRKKKITETDIVQG